jgi:hypothetical protein
MTHCGDKGGNFYAMVLILACGITFATQSLKKLMPNEEVRTTCGGCHRPRLGRSLGARKAQHGGLVMPCVLALVIAIAMGLLVIGS